MVKNKREEKIIRAETASRVGLKAIFHSCPSFLLLEDMDDTGAYPEAVVIHPEDAPKLLKIIKKFIKDSKNAEKETHTAGTVASTLPQVANDNTSGSTGPL